MVLSVNEAYGAFDAAVAERAARRRGQQTGRHSRRTTHGQRNSDTAAAIREATSEFRLPYDEDSDYEYDDNIPQAMPQSLDWLNSTPGQNLLADPFNLAEDEILGRTQAAGPGRSRQPQVTTPRKRASRQVDPQQDASVSQLMGPSGACSGCGSCLDELFKLLKLLRADPQASPAQPALAQQPAQAIVAAAGGGGLEVQGATQQQQTIIYALIGVIVLMVVLFIFMLRSINSSRPASSS